MYDGGEVDDINAMYEMRTSLAGTIPIFRSNTRLRFFKLQRHNRRISVEWRLTSRERGANTICSSSSGGLRDANRRVQLHLHAR